MDDVEPKNKLKNNIINGLKYYVVDTTGLLTVSTPIFAAFETFASGMSVETSLESRMKVAELSYLGLALAYTKGRDLSKYIFKINDLSSKKLRRFHDGFYTALFNIGVATPVYLSSGADLVETIKATAITVLFSFFAGPINGFGVDMYRDLTGIKPSISLPKKIKDMTPNVKKGVAVGLIAASVGLTALVYETKDAYSDYFDDKKNIDKKNINLVMPNISNERKDNCYYPSF